MSDFLRGMADATWLWLPLLVLFLVQGLQCSPTVKFTLFKIGRYYIVSIIGIQFLVSPTHPILRAFLFDLGTRTFLFLEAAELLWFGWSAWRTGTYHHQSLPDGEVTLALLIWYAVSALLYLGWIILGVAFAFTLLPGI